MITLHRLNKQEFVLNADLIETIEATPDTLVTLINGKKMMVRDGIAEVIDRIINFRRMCNSSIQVVHIEKSETPAPGETGAPGGADDGTGRPKSGVRGGT